MEVKLSRGRDLSVPKFLLPNQTSFSSYSFTLKSWLYGKKSFGKHLRGVAKRWRIQIQKMSRGQHLTERLVVHVVKEGETLTSISRQYGVSVYLIAAANENIVDVDLVFRGQILNIPASSKRNTQVGHQGSINILNSCSRQKIFSVLTPQCLTHAKTAGPILLLVPLIAFCVRCIIWAFHTRIARGLVNETADETERNHHRPNSLRWKSALSDIRESDISDSELEPDSNICSEDLAHLSLEEASHAYSRLEIDYQKFLTECGISECGYWRGGSPD